MRARVSACCVLALLAAGCGKDRSGRISAELERIATTYHSGKVEEAAAELQQYVKKHPRDDLAWTILGHACADLKRNGDAAEAYAQALAINPKQFKAIVGQGILYRRVKDYGKAMAAYERAVEIDPKYAEAYSSMAIIALKRRDYAKAVELARKAHDLDATEPAIAANLAVAYHCAGDAARRDELTAVAKRLGYKNMKTLQAIYDGEMTIED